ncbi:MAG: PorV/PorQ family protein [Candidatus Hydrogenedentota bacterium]
MIRIFLITVILILCLIFSLPVYCREQDAGATTGDFLTIGVSSRAAAIGEAYSAFAEGPEGLFYNPAGLTSNQRAEAGFMYYTLFEDISFNYLGFVRPLKEKKSAYGLGLIYLDYGDLERIGLDPATGDLFRMGTFDAYDMALSAGYAYDVGEDITLGGACKVIQSNIDNVTANAFAVDLGVKFHSVFRYLDASFVIQNMGSKMKFIQAKENLPVTMRAGLNCHLIEERLNIGVEVFKRSSEDIEVGVGAEFFPWYQFCLRVGYNSEDEAQDGVRAGFGVLFDNFRFDYAYIPNDKFEDGHRFTGTVMFGPPPPKPLPQKEEIEKEKPYIEEEEVEEEEVLEEKVEEEYEREIEEAKKEREKIKLKEQRKKELEEALSTVLEKAEREAYIKKEKEVIKEEREEEVTKREIPKEVEEAVEVVEEKVSLEYALDLFNNKQYEECITILKELAERPDADFNIIYNLATAYYTTYRFALATKYYQKAVDLKPTDADAHLYLGYSYYQLGSIDRAVSEWKIAYELNPNNTQARDALKAFNISE